MQFIPLTDEMINAGKAALNEYLQAVLCGPVAEGYQDNMWRDTGVRMAPGAIAACIERGVDTRNGIVNAVARAARCRRWNVESVLDALSGDDSRIHLWRQMGGRYRLITGSPAAERPRAVLAA